MPSYGGTAPSLEAAASEEAVSSSCWTWQRGQRLFRSRRPFLPPPRSASGLLPRKRSTTSGSCCRSGDRFLTWRALGGKESPTEGRRQSRCCQSACGPIDPGCGAADDADPSSPGVWSPVSRWGCPWDLEIRKTFKKRKSQIKHR